MSNVHSTKKHELNGIFEFEAGTLCHCTKVEIHSSICKRQFDIGVKLNTSSIYFGSVNVWLKGKTVLEVNRDMSFSFHYLLPLSCFYLL